MKHARTPAQRAAEAAKLESDIRALGLPEQDLDPVLGILQDYRNGQGYSGTVKLPHLNLAFVVKLSLQAHIDNGVRLTALVPVPRRAHVP